MEGPEALGAPPPYAPPENARPPPYAPDNATTTENTQAGSTQHTSYGTGNPCKHDTPIQQQPAPPYCAVDPNPQLNTSTTLLVSHEKKPPTFFVLSLITCLCFSPLFGLLAMVFAVLSDSAWTGGDSDTAKKYSQVAMSLSVVGIMITIFTIIIVFTTGAIRLHPVN